MNQLDIHFNKRTVQRGRALFRDGAVLQYRYDPSEHSLLSLVQGTQATPYEVEVYLDDEDEPVEAWCTCPVELNCKHAVATMLAFQSAGTQVTGRKNRATAEPGGTPLPHASVDPAAIKTRQWWERWRATERKVVPPTRMDRTRNQQRSRIYALRPLNREGDQSIGVSVTLLDAPRTVAGHFNKGRRAEPDYGFAGYDVQLTSVDKDIEAMGSARLQADQGRYTRDDGRYELKGHFGQLMLELAIKTGRCFLENDRHQPLTTGVSRALAIDWQAASRDCHQMVPTLAGLEHWWLVATEQPWWIDPHSATAGPIDTELSGEQLGLLLEAPAMPESQLHELTEWYSDTPAEPTAAPLLPLPPVTLAPLIDAKPSPVLILHSPTDNPHVDSWQLALLMRYDNVMLPCELAQGTAITRAVNEQGETVRVKRDYELETVHFFELMRRAPGLLPQTQHDSRDLVSTFEASGETPAERFGVYRQLVLRQNELEQDDWQLVVLPPVHTEPLRPSSFDGLVERADDGSPGWFDLSLGIELDGERYDLIPLVVAYLERGGGDEPLFAETVNGRFMQVEAAILRPVADVLHELGTPADHDGTVRLSRTRALSLENLDTVLSDEGIDTVWRGTRKPFEFARQLRQLANVDTKAFDKTTLPRGLKATLRPYQRSGLGWLNALASNNLCGVLADDMGLGKTLQTLAHILWLRQSRRLKGPALVVAPTSLLLNWAREAERFTPRLKVRIWHGLARHEQPLDAIEPPAHLVITSYGLALRDRDLLADHGFDMLVLDEAQQIRNALAKTTRAIKSLPIERRLCLSGTPLENHLGELWSQFDFLMPELLGDVQRFNSHYRTPIERHGDTARQQRLAAAVKPFLLRRKKEDVATDLPPKTEMLREVHLGTAQAKLYESIRVSMQTRVRKALQSKGLAQSRVTVLDALLKLRQCCCHPELVKLDSAKRIAESAKTTLAVDMIDELIAEGRRILVFSSFTSMLGILERELKTRGHRWVKLTGQTRKRDTVIDAFQRGDVPLFLISLKAGGTGLNLTAADNVIHYDPWWNPAAEAQASARAHRIGQDKPVFIYKLVAADTVEQRIVAMQQRKQELADAMIEGGDGASLTSLSVEETLALFDPD